MTALRENIGIFIDAITNDTQSPIQDWRGRVMCFRDYRFDSDWWEPGLFVRDAAQLREQLGSLWAHGGGDEPESLLDALYLVAKMDATEPGTEHPEQWRHRKAAARVVVVFTDATYHPKMSIPEASGGMASDVAHLVMANKLRLFLFAPDHDCYAELDSHLDNCCEWEPIEGPEFAQSLSDFTSDIQNFRKVMRGLAKSITVSVAVVEL